MALRGVRKDILLRVAFCRVLAFTVEKHLRASFRALRPTQPEMTGSFCIRTAASVKPKRCTYGRAFEAREWQDSSEFRGWAEEGCSATQHMRNNELRAQRSPVEHSTIACTSGFKASHTSRNWAARMRLQQPATSSPRSSSTQQSDDDGSAQRLRENELCSP